jgi:copper chaperone CopZ
MKNFILFCFLFSTNVIAKNYQVNVGGMSCESCAKKITEKFQTLKHVKQVKVNVQDDLMSIETEGEQELSEDLIKSTLTELGYSFKGFKS